MARKKSNTFTNLWYMGLSLVSVPVVIVLIFVFMASISKKVEVSKPTDKVKIEKVIEKVYIHDTVEIPCKRKHCDEHTQKKPESKPETLSTNKPDTLN